MSLDLTPEQKAIGKDNFHRAVGELGATPPNDPNRRDFMKGLLAAGAGAAVAGGAVYAGLPITASVLFGYDLKKVDKPVKAALIGAGDEGGVLIGEHNPQYLEFIAVADLRPTNRKRIFTGDLDASGRPRKDSPRKGFNYHYGNDAETKIQKFTDYKEMLDKVPDIEAVVIAVPLIQHAPIAIECMKRGKHVLCEKLMAWNIEQCKEMIKVAKENDRILSVGHQRHYSMLYAHVLEVLNAGVLGDIRHIRAYWHRNNTWPKLDKDGKEIPGTFRDSWRPDVSPEDRAALEKEVRKWGYKSMEELVRWRLYNRTGGGLMAELGSHQLDACSIFLGKVKPLAVSGVGGKIFYKDDRDADDHVFVTFEFPGRGYFSDESRTAIKDKDDRVVVTYSSINTNGMEGWGECLMGTRGTLIVDREQEAFLYAEGGGAGRSTAVGVSGAGGGKPALDASASAGGGAAAAANLGQRSLGFSVSRGYREEMEHFAYCIRMWEQMPKDERPLPRCHGTVAMADAIIALTSNLAMKHQKRIEFKPEWFDPESPEVPDAENKVEDITA